MMSETRHLSKDILAGLPEPVLGKSFIRRGRKGIPRYAQSQS
jgi:hypothetical protein